MTCIRPSPSHDFKFFTNYATQKAQLDSININLLDTRILTNKYQFT